VYYFPEEKENSCVAYMPTYDIEQVYKQLKTDAIILSADVLTWVGAIQDVRIKMTRMINKDVSGS
jgi:hypothetical protein